jgi:Outer membrane protein beta-barrel domain
MKQSLLFFLLLSGLGAAAQTEQGNYLVGGTAQLNTVKNQTTIELSPSAGYFFTDDFAAGANITLSYSKYGEGSGVFKSTSFGVGPFIRYYAGSTGVRPFLQGDGNFTSIKTKANGSSSTSTGITYFVGPGAAFFLNRNVALEALAGYSHAAYKNQNGRGGFAFRIGFQVYLSKAEVETVTNGQ